MDIHVIEAAGHKSSPESATPRKRNIRAVKYMSDVPGRSSTRVKSHRLGSPFSETQRDSTRRAPRSLRKDHGFAHLSASPTISTATSSSSSCMGIREEVQLEMARLGRKGCIMDFVLDARSPSVDYSEELFLELEMRSRVLSPLRHEYAFARGQAHSLEDYWEEQEWIWAGVDRVDYSETARFPDSYERGPQLYQVGDRGVDRRELSEMLFKRLSSLAALLYAE